MTISVQYRVRLNWNGNRVFNELYRNLERGLDEALRLYRQEIILELTKVVGSRPLGGNKRLRIQHSSPGEAPYVQTFNLAKSPKISKSRLRSTIRGRVSTDVSYARTLERGGLALPGRRKKYTANRLVNPIKTQQIIAPRPAWLPVFLRLEPQLVRIIRNAGSR